MIKTLRNLAKVYQQSAGRSVRMYAGARPSRLSGGYILNSSSDMELVTSLQTLRGRSRQLMRDASYAKQIRRIVQNNVVGGGIGIQGRIANTKGELHKTLNDAMEECFEKWSCSDGFHTAGQLHLADMERVAMGEIVEAGEVFIRIHRSKFGNSRIPLSLELIEAELVADNMMPAARYPGNTVRMGIEVDNFYRPVGYYFHERFLGELMLGQPRSDQVYFVPASDIIHLRVLDRFPQTRGVPWIHTVDPPPPRHRRLQRGGDCRSARRANYFAAIKSPRPQPLHPREASRRLAASAESEPGIIMKMAPGEEMEFFAPNRPEWRDGPVHAAHAARGRRWRRRVV
jgi:capsid protein